MATSLRSVMDLMMPLIPEDFKTDNEDDIELAELGCVEMGVALGKEFTFTGSIDDDTRSIEQDLSMAERWLASRFTYRAYLTRLKDELNQNAVNFSTLTFSVKGLEKRPEAINDSLYSLNKYLESEIAKAKGTDVIGVVTQFGGSSSE